ncbi:MAG: NAD(+) diphosphatase [Actinomycetales bacterium]|nr:NAD(+) diphosphatase [Actinomycetales bacterium]
MGIIPDLPLARFAVDRAAQVRASKSWLADLWQHEQTRVLYILDGKVPVTEDLSLVLTQSHASPIPDKSEVLLLGIDDEHAYLAVMSQPDSELAPLWVSLRETGSMFSARDVGLAITATALATWHATHKFCPRCGLETIISDAGWSRQCPNSCVTHFPRTEPAIIVSIEDSQERILLGRRAGWPQEWYSTLAGFVEAGESCEAAVVREVYEEAGVEIDINSLEYLGSQPWPYPASLMLGYRALALSDHIEADGEEIAHLAWFTRAEFESLCRAGALKLPNPAAISWYLIQFWFGQPLEVSWSRG